MIYLEKFHLLTEIEEERIEDLERRNIFNSHYPFNIFPNKQLEELEFSDITILHGNNGSGKTTILNLISQKLNSDRKNNIDLGSYFKLYTRYTKIIKTKSPIEIKMISSDDVFDYLLDLQAMNSNINRRKEELSKEYFAYKNVSSQNFYNDYEKLKIKILANKQTLSKFVRERLVKNNIISQSNGETALSFWANEIKENGIYILDEPENSLSAENQLKLKKFIEDSVRFYNCQFIISTHSPFLLLLKDAKIYDLDSNPVAVKDCKELANVKLYLDFFKEYF